MLQTGAARSALVVYDARHDGRPTSRIAPLGWTVDNRPAEFM